jgi:hypothetical protein
MDSHVPDALVEVALEKPYPGSDGTMKVYGNSESEYLALAKSSRSRNSRGLPVIDATCEQGYVGYAMIEAYLAIHGVERVGSHLPSGMEALRSVSCTVRRRRQSRTSCNFGKS